VGTLASTLSLGAAYFDGEGNLLQSSSGAVFTLDSQIGANNKNQLNGIIATKWSDATADIPTQIRALQYQSSVDTGYEIEYAFYGKSVPSYLTTNNYMKEYGYRNASFNQEYLYSAEIPDGTLGIKKWIPAYKVSYDKYDGTKQSLFGDKIVAFTPNPKYWYKLFAGTRLIPKTIGIWKDISEALGNLTEEQGMCAYAYLDPRTTELFMNTGDVCLPSVCNNLALYVATVDF
jgi:hypothetical protein